MTDLVPIFDASDPAETLVAHDGDVAPHAIGPAPADRAACTLAVETPGDTITCTDDGVNVVLGTEGFADAIDRPARCEEDDARESTHEDKPFDGQMAVDDRAAASDGATVDDDAQELPAPATALAPKAGSKPALILKLLRRKNGASIKALEEVTGWQPHSLRSAMTGLRKSGIAIERRKTKAGETVYAAAKA